MRKIFIDDVGNLPFAFPTFCFTPCIVKRGSRCLLIVKLGICIPSGDLTIQLLPMVFLWAIFSCLEQSIVSQLFSFELPVFFSVSQPFPLIYPSLLDRESRSILPMSCRGARAT